MQEAQNPTPPELDEKVGAGETATDAAATPAATDTMPSLEESLKAAELKAAEHHDAWLRAKAETENMRRRAQEDIAKAHKFAAEKFAGELLAVKDSLEAALANETQDCRSLKAGVELTLKQLVAAFEKSTVSEINPLGEKFDPHHHQAIARSMPSRKPIPSSTCCKRAMPCTSASCARRWYCRRNPNRHRAA